MITIDDLTHEAEKCKQRDYEALSKFPDLIRDYLTPLVPKVGASSFEIEEYRKAFNVVQFILDDVIGTLS